MHIAYIAAGAGWTYCGACARDATLLRGLTAAGHEARYVPLYTPIRHDESPEIPEEKIFYGGLTVSLRQWPGLLRMIPSALRRILDRPRLLRWLSRFAVHVNPAALGPLTVSVLAGAEGRQRQELEELLNHLEQLRPDVVHLSNSLLSGIAGALKTRLKVPMVCAFQGEDSFVAALPEPYRSQANRLICENGKHTALYIAPCQAAVGTMQGFLGVEAERIRVVRTGISPQMYLSAQARKSEPPFTIGYFSAIKPEKGLDLLVEAVRRLVQEQNRPVMLAAAGQILNRPYWNKVQRQIARAKLEPHVRFAGELDFPQKVVFLHGCDLAVFPSRISEWRGVAAMEAMAAGVPVVAPERGIFPELLAGGGGKLFTPENVESLTGTLNQLLENPQELEMMGKQGVATIAEGFSDEQMVRETVRAYEFTCKKPVGTNL